MLFIYNIHRKKNKQKLTVPILDLPVVNLKSVFGQSNLPVRTINNLSYPQTRIKLATKLVVDRKYLS